MKAPARPDVLRLEPLRPTAETSAELRAAFYRLTAAREDNTGAIGELLIERTRRVGTGTTADINATDDTLRHRRAFAEQLDLLEADLRGRFNRAKEAEEDAEYDAKLAEVKAAEATWNAKFQDRYSVLSAEIIELLRRETALLSAYNDLARLPGAARALLAPGTLALTASMQSAYLSGNPHFGAPLTFAASIVLPGLTPDGPLWLGRRWKL